MKSNTPHNPGTNPMMHGYGFLPNAAFEESKPDKDTHKIHRYDIYEVWRDVLLYTCLGMTIFGGAWFFQVIGYAAAHQWLIWLYRMSGLVSGGWVIGHFLSFKPCVIKSGDKNRIIGRLLLYTLGIFLSSILMYSFYA